MRSLLTAIPRLFLPASGAHRAAPPPAPPGPLIPPPGPAAMGQDRAVLLEVAV